MDTQQLEQQLETATAAIRYLDMGDGFVLECVPVEIELARADWPAGMHFEDAPEAIEEPRGPSGWNGAANAIDLRGQRFGKLLVVARAAGNTRQGAFLRAVCDCGGEAVVKSSHLRSGHATSCGCVKRAKQFQPGSNEPPRAEPGAAVTEEQAIRDELLADLCERIARARAVNARLFRPSNGSQPRAWERRLRNRIAWRCRSLPEGARQLRVERIFKSIVVGLTSAGSPAIADAA
jgi:hypothetical protein